MEQEENKPKKVETKKVKTFDQFILECFSTTGGGSFYPEVTLTLTDGKSITDKILGVTEGAILMQDGTNIFVNQIVTWKDVRKVE